MEEEFCFITADDHSVITRSLEFILKDLYNGAVVYRCSSLDDVLKVLPTTTVHLLMLDITFPGENPLGVLPYLKRNYPGLKILIFSGHEESLYAVRYINAGANGYLSKLSTEKEIKNAISQVMDNGRFYSEDIKEKIMDNYILKKPMNILEQLSHREFEIAKLMVDGQTNYEISKTLKLVKSTVATYRKRIFDKLEVDSLPDLMQLFNLYHDEET